MDDLLWNVVLPVVVFGLLGLAVWRSVFRRRGRMVCPLCGKGLKGTEMVTIQGTVYHRRCYDRRH